MTTEFGAIDPEIIRRQALLGSMWGVLDTTIGLDGRAIGDDMRISLPSPGEYDDRGRFTGRSTESSVVMHRFGDDCRPPRGDGTVELGTITISQYGMADGVRVRTSSDVLRFRRIPEGAFFVERDLGDHQNLNGGDGHAAAKRLEAQFSLHEPTNDELAEYDTMMSARRRELEERLYASRPGCSRIVGALAMRAFRRSRFGSRWQHEPWTTREVDQ